MTFFLNRVTISFVPAIDTIIVVLLLEVNFLDMSDCTCRVVRVVGS